MSNLPEWNGAATVYDRCETICRVLNARKYEHDRRNDKRKSFRFTSHDDARAIIDAMNKGNEEILKAFCHEYRELWLTA